MFTGKKSKQRENEGTTSRYSAFNHHETLHTGESQMNGAPHSSGMSNGLSHSSGMPNGLSHSSGMPNGINDATINKKRNFTRLLKYGITKTKPENLAAGSDQIQTDSHMETRQNEDNNAIEALTKMNLKVVKCSKHPGHAEFIPINDLQDHHLHPYYQNQDWVKLIKLKGQETVLITVSKTSPLRPDDLGFAQLKGTNKERTGSGTAFIMNMENIENCHCSEILGPHKVSGCFKVMTVAHVVYNDEEAENTVIEFFYDDNDRSAVVKARGVRVSHVDVERNRSVIECRTHDLTLYQRLMHARQERIRLIQGSLATQINHEPMVVLISHPHGYSKCVSIGKLLDIKEEGDIKTTKDGIELVGCILTYDTPTCPGTGGGSINLFGNGEVCYAFAPHCASHSTGKNVSGLGWTKYVKNIQLRVLKQHV